MANTIQLEEGGPVVVGVDGSPASLVAARFGVAEAHRFGTMVRLVHVVPDYIAMAPMYPLPPDELTDAGRVMLRELLDELGPIDPEVRVQRVVRRGSRVAALTSDARGARLLVVGSDRRPVTARLLTGNTSTGVAASAASPVVAVPETWDPDRSTGVVVVGIKRPTRVTELFGEAFAVAHARGARLVVMHAWKLPSEYDDIVAGRTSREQWDARARTELEGPLAEWREAYPEVEVEVRTIHDQPAHALVAVSAEADELVLLRRAHGIPAAAHLGSTARAVLREAQCPVRIVPPGHVVALPGLSLEDSGTMRK
ncbi:hypothetical protein GGQ22_15735 [Nocardioides sp. zg-579]|uniref:UspA domain-containing protein n=1 Tax=Nocardioides marmotae TaxID=2663857 RepID=A0A6I3JE85_9ACTN|nr:universal stress protein [Nocardioides marmotae]MCR6032876.1 hypothetical protein [Gordonia jinghuaiqii]MTB96526.1 hypothetical protein [Nocardioides marmotae]QKE01953.1 universal stress protein [Nocardioides marmotae]